MGSKQLGSNFLQRSQICSHTPSALNAGAKRSDVAFGHASMLLLGEGSEATEPYNKYDKIRSHCIRSLQFDQKVRPLSFRPEKFDLFTATLLVSPSGRLPWVRYSPRGSIIQGKSRVSNVCFMRESRVASREKRPALLLQERPCNPSRSTPLPQWHVCATQMLAPRRKPIEIGSC